MLKQISSAVLAAVFLIGCASTQLNLNTLDLASTSENLVESQILDNLSKIRKQPYAIPSQVSIPSGSATTTGSLSPTLTDPLNSTVTSTTQLANTVGATLSSTGTSVSTKTRTNMGLNITGTDQWSQNWSLTPLTDPDQLRRLRALYRFGAGIDQDISCDYPLVKKATASGSSNAAGTVTIPIDQGKRNVTINIGNGVTVDVGGKPAGDRQASKYNVTCWQDNKETVETIENLDPAFLAKPSCIFCDQNPNADFSKPHEVQKNDRLVNGWLRFEDHPGSVYLSRDNGLSLYAASQEDMQHFYDFILFVLEASLMEAPSTGGAAGGKGGSTKTPEFILQQVPGPPPVLR